MWVRRLYTTPEGRDLVAMDSRRRLFGGLLRRMLVLRDDVCTTPWCEAPIVHADHTTPARDGGRTGFEDGNGKCARCNQTKEAPGWRTRVTHLQLGDHRHGSDHQHSAGRTPEAARRVDGSRGWFRSLPLWGTSTPPNRLHCWAGAARPLRRGSVGPRRTEHRARPPRRRPGRRRRGCRCRCRSWRRGRRPAPDASPDHRTAASDHFADREPPGGHRSGDDHV